MDIEKIRPGSNFIRAIEESLGFCAAAVVVIGRDWLTTTDVDGKRRLDDPNDFVHIEVATALQSRIRVIPALVEDAAMPVKADLPPDLALLTEQQAIELTDSRWDYDTGRLIEAIEEATGEVHREGKKKARAATISGQIVAAGVIGLILTIIFGYFFFYPPHTPPDTVYAVIFLVLTAIAYGTLHLFEKRRKRR